MKHHPGSTLRHVAPTGTRRGNARGMRSGTGSVVSGAYALHLATQAQRLGVTGARVDGASAHQLRRLVASQGRSSRPRERVRTYSGHMNGGATRIGPGLAGLGSQDSPVAPVVRVLSRDGDTEDVRLETGTHANATFSTARLIEKVEVLSKDPGTTCHFDPNSQVRNWAWHSGPGGGGVTAGNHSAFGPCRATFRITYAAQASADSGDFPPFDRYAAELKAALQSMALGQRAPSSIPGRLNPLAYPPAADWPENVKAAYNAFLAVWTDEDDGYEASVAYHNAISANVPAPPAPAAPANPPPIASAPTPTTPYPGSTGRVFTTPGDVYGVTPTPTVPAPTTRIPMAPPLQDPQEGTGAPAPVDDVIVEGGDAKGAKARNTAVGLGLIVLVGGGLYLASRRKRRSR